MNDRPGIAEAPGSRRGAPPPVAPAPAAPAPRPIPDTLVLPVRALDLGLARFGQGVGGVALVGACAAAAVSPVTGGALAVFALAAIVFYTSLHRVLAEPAGAVPPWARWAAPTFEIALPAACLWVLSRTEGAEYAIGSWVPAQLFAGFVVASILRLDPRVPLAMGVGSAAAYLAVWALAIRPALADDVLLHDPAIQAARALTLVAIGAGSAVAAARLRQIVALPAVPGVHRLGDYELGPDIASGAMGRVVDAVYRPEIPARLGPLGPLAADRGGFQRRVALKLLHPHLATDPVYVERFRVEAELAGRLVHPNLVPAIDFGRVGDSWFMAMEFVEGRTLQEVLQERRKVGKPLPPRVVAWLGLQLAQGVDHAHARAKDERGGVLRVVHRDLSPSNVLIDRAGRVRITDFGVARALGDLPSLHTHTLVGKPGYVAPEVLKDHEVDESADLWSLGVMLWELLANERLFARDNEGATMLAVIEAPIPPPSERRAALVAGALAPHWDALLGRMLSRDRSARLPTAAAVIDALERIAAAEGQVLPQDVREMLAREEGLEELALDETSDEIPSSVLPSLLDALDAAPVVRPFPAVPGLASNRPPDRSGEPG